jgi:Protein kinase domain
MANIGKIAGGIGLIAAGVATVIAGPLLVGPSLDPAALREAAAAAGKDAATAMRAHFELLEATTSEAANSEHLRAAIKNRVDGATLVDLFATEDWWKTRRAAFALTRVVIGSSVASFGDLAIGEQDRQIVGQARKTRVGSGMAVVGGRPAQIAAARIEARDEVAPVLVLGQYFEEGMLRALADRTQLGLLLAAADKPILSAAGSDQRDLLRDASEELAKTPGSEPVIRAEQGWVAASNDVGAGIRLWAVRPLPRSSGGGKQPIGLWALAGLFAAAGATLLVFAGKKRATGSQSAAPTEVPHEDTMPFGTGRNQQPMKASGKIDVPTKPRVDKNGALAAPPPHKLTPVATSVGQPEKPRTFGRYRLLELLGVGGMSEVYTAVAHGAEGFQRTFVVKRLRPELARDKEAISQFIDEARIQSVLLHSNIVPVFDFGTMGDEFFMAQEYVIGRDLMRLSTRCIEKTNFCLEPRIVYYIIHETLQALAYAHGKKDKSGAPMGIVHRDVSASNIMVTGTGDVRLFDFGIAKAHPGNRQAQTQAGLVKGNANFMSPEQARGQTVDARSDLFSLGMVLYYCLTGCLFYSGDNDLDVLYRAACGPSEQDLAALDQLPGPAGAILRKALAFKPDDRFQTAEEFAAALTPYAVGMKPEAAKLMEQLFGSELTKEAAA